MSLREIREQLLKEGKQARCKFCHQQLQTKLWMEVLIAQAMHPMYDSYKPDRKVVEGRIKGRGWIEPSGFCNDCDKFAAKMDKTLNFAG